MASSDDVTVPKTPTRPSHSPIRGAATLALELAAIALAYFVLAKFGLMMASVNPSATPIWPASGLALAAVLLRGYRIVPAILVGAFLVNAITAGSLETSAVIAVGNTLEAVLGARLICVGPTGSTASKPRPASPGSRSYVSCRQS